MKKGMLTKGVSVLALAAIAAGCFSGCRKGGTVDPEPQPTGERTVLMEDFNDDEYAYYVTKEATQISYEGGIVANENAKEFLPDGRALDINIKKFVSEMWAGYAEDTGLAAITGFDLFSTPKNNGNWGFEWKYLTGLAIDVYNPNPFAVRVSLYNYTTAHFPVNFGTVTVQPGEVTVLEAKANRYFMQNEFNDSFTFALLAINYDKTLNEKGELYYPEAHVFVDNLRATVNETPVTVNGKTTVEKKLASKNEILNFDDAGDLSYIRETGCSYAKEADNQWETYSFFLGTGSAYYYNSNPRYIYEGNKGSCEWRITPTTNDKFTQENYAFDTRFPYTNKDHLTGLTVVGDYLDHLNFSQLQSGRVKIRMDVYNAASYDKEVFFGIHDMRGTATEIKTEFPFIWGTTDMTDECYRLKAGEWTTVEISDFSHLDLASGLARLRVMTTLLDVNEEISFYLNNLRFVYDDEDDRVVAEQATGNPSADRTAPKIYSSYEYKIVKANEAVTLPAIRTSETATVEYKLDGEPIAAGASFTPTEAGAKKLVVTATDAAGNKGTKEIAYTVTENDADLNKLYALDDENGLVYHAGKAGMGLNNLRLSLVRSGDARPKDVFGNEIPAAEGVPDSYITFTNYYTVGRFVLTNPLAVNPQEKFSELYFWFYNAGERGVTISFNNKMQWVGARSGWTKIVISDFSTISSSGRASDITSMIDLGDMVGSYVMITAEIPYEKYAMTAIYGTPIAAE